MQNGRLWKMEQNLNEVIENLASKVAIKSDELEYFYKLELANKLFKKLGIEYSKVAISASELSQAMREFTAERVDANQKRYHPLIWIFVKHQYKL